MKKKYRDKSAQKDWGCEDEAKTVYFSRKQSFKIDKVILVILDNIEKIETNTSEKWWHTRHTKCTWKCVFIWASSVQWWIFHSRQTKELWHQVRHPQTATKSPFTGQEIKRERETNPKNTTMWKYEKMRGSAPPNNYSRSLFQSDLWIFSPSLAAAGAPFFKALKSSQFYWHEWKETNTWKYLIHRWYHYVICKSWHEKERKTRRRVACSMRALCPVTVLIVNAWGWPNNISLVDLKLSSLSWVLPSSLHLNSVLLFFCYSQL